MSHNHHFLNTLIKLIIFENKFENLIKELELCEFDKFSFKFHITLNIKKNKNDIKYHGTYYFKSNTLQYIHKKQNTDPIIELYKRNKSNIYLKTFLKNNYLEYYEYIILLEEIC